MGSDYRLSAVLAARFAGVLLVVVGVVVAVVALLVAVLDCPGWLLGTALVGAVAVAVAGGVTISRRPVLLHLDDEGYQVRLLRGSGVAGARWADVEDMVAETVAGDACLVLRLRDGRRTTLPVRMLAAPTEQVADDLRARLDRGQGHRRLR